MLIASGQPQGYISPDYYRFTLSASTTVHATLHNWGIDYDGNGHPILGIFTFGNSFPVATSTTASGPMGSYQTLTATLPAGSYAVCVTGTHYDNEEYWLNGGLSYHWPYELTIGTAALSAPTNRYLDNEWRSGFPANNSLATAQALGALPAFSTIHGVRYQSLTGSVSPDFFSFSLATRTYVQINLNTWGRGYTIVRPLVGIFNASGNQSFPSPTRAATPTSASCGISS